MAHVHEKEVIERGISGVVKWFNVKNGYGFIKRYDTGNDVFVHRTAILSRKRIRSVGDGEIVQFDVAIGEKGLEAINVTGPNGQPVKGSPYALSRMKRRGRFAYSYHDARGDEGSYSSSSAPNLGVEFRTTRIIEHHQASWHTLPLSKSEWQVYTKKSSGSSSNTTNDNASPVNNLEDENESADSDKLIKAVPPSRYSSCSSDLNVRHSGRSHRRRIPATSRSSSESDIDNTSDEPTSSTESTNSEHESRTPNTTNAGSTTTTTTTSSSTTTTTITTATKQRKDNIKPNFVASSSTPRDITKCQSLPTNSCWRRVSRMNPTR